MKNIHKITIIFIIFFIHTSQKVQSRLNIFFKLTLFSSIN